MGGGDIKRFPVIVNCDFSHSFLDTIYAKCDNFVAMEGDDGKFEYQITADDTKSWFDSVRACKVNNSPVPDLDILT